MSDFSSSAYLNDAKAALRQSEGDVNFDATLALSNQAIAYALIALALEMQELNERFSRGIPVEDVYRK
jgi:hypothetical protein